MFEGRLNMLIGIIAIITGALTIAFQNQGDLVNSAQLPNKIKNVEPLATSERTTSTLASTTTASTSTTSTTPPSTDACEKLSKDNINFCPPGFNKSSENFCYFMTNMTNSSVHALPCHYPNNLPYSTIKHFISSTFNDSEFWINARRNRTEVNRFGHFEWTERGETYGQAVKEHVLNLKGNSEKDCLIVRNDSFIPTHCFEKHKSLCVYAYDSTKYCSNHSTTGECIPDSLDFVKGSCYCKKHLNQPYPTRQDSCDHLAEPREPFQTNILLQGFQQNSEVCWFGLQQNNNNTFVWSSSGTPIAYNYWSKYKNCSYSDGAIDFVTDSGWTLKEDRSLNCSICKVSNNLPFLQPRLRLYHHITRDVLELIIDNISSISDLYGSNDLYCFTDSNEEEFKGSLKIERDIKHNSTKPFKLNLENISNNPGHYWCEAFQIQDNHIITSDVMVTYNRSLGYGHEYSLTIDVDTEQHPNPLLTDLHVRVCQLLLTKIRENTTDLFFHSLRPMTVLQFDEAQGLLTIIAHLTTSNTSNFQDSLPQQHAELLNILNNAMQQDSRVTLQEFLSCEVCLPHTTYTSDNEPLNWPETNIGATAIPRNKLCLDAKQTPVTRKCGGNFTHGAKWANAKGDCPKHITNSEISQELFDLLNKTDATTEEISESLTRLTKEADKSTLIDVYLVSSLLQKLVQKENRANNKTFLQIISNVMNYKRNVLRDSQNLLNSTDQVIMSLEDFLAKEEPNSLDSQNILIQIVDLTKRRVTGVALFKNSLEKGNALENYKLDLLMEGTTVAGLINRADLEAAVLFTDEALQEIKNQLQSIKLITTVFDNGVLFNEQEDPKEIQETLSKVLSASIPGFSGYFEFPVQMIFKLPKDYTNIKKCSYWAYGWNQLMVSIHGRWNFDELSQNHGNLMEVCDFFHMTHFGLLLPGKLTERLAEHYDNLEILTAIGSALSLIGIFPIFITAVIFQKWRSESGNIILINFCVAITLQTIVLFASGAVTRDGVPCVIVGVLMHYLVLSEFFWMLVIAVLQHRRFVVVFAPTINNIVKKCALVGWGLPLLPVLITLCISPANYSMAATNFCYPTGKYLQFALFLPIILILCINGLIFAKILYSISRQNAISVAATQRTHKLELLLAFVLFFVLGMTWVFGLIGTLTGIIAFTYIFCSTATIRGLVLFLFFVCANKETRSMWRRRSTYYINKPFDVFGRSKNSSEVAKS